MILGIWLGLTFGSLRKKITILEFLLKLEAENLNITQNCQGYVSRSSGSTSVVIKTVNFARVYNIRLYSSVAKWNTCNQ